MLPPEDDEQRTGGAEALPVDNIVLDPLLIQIRTERIIALDTGGDDDSIHVADHIFPVFLRVGDSLS